MLKKKLAIILVLSTTVFLVACGINNAPKPSPTLAAAPIPTIEPVVEDSPPEESLDVISLSWFTNLPNRTSGQGLVEQMLLDAYMEENPHIRINVEALDDESYKTKLEEYATKGEMPDIISGWGQPSFLDAIIGDGLLAELNMEDYADYGFIEHFLSDFSRDDKLYGLPRDISVMGFYYNKALFDENGWSAPGNLGELVGLTVKMREAELEPVSVAGSEIWPLTIMLTDIYTKLYGAGVLEKQESFIENKNWDDPVMLGAATMFQKACDAGFFMEGFESFDYATAKMLFTSGQASMYYSSNLDIGMTVNVDIPSSIRENLHVFALPSVIGGKGSDDDISAWSECGYFVSENSMVKEEALKLLAFFFKPGNWNRLAWENKACISAQDFSGFLTGDETPVELEFADILTNASSFTGNTFRDVGTPEFKEKYEKAIVDLSLGNIKPEKFISEMSRASRN